MDVSVVRERLASAADVISGLTCTGFVPDSVTEPHFYTAETDITYTRTFGGDMDLEVICRVLASRADDRASQKLLDGYLKGSGATSLKAALEADTTLAGACDDLHVVRMQGYRWYEHGTSQYVGAELVVRVIGDGS